MSNQFGLMLAAYAVFEFSMLFITVIGANTLATEQRLHGLIPWWACVSAGLMMLGWALPLGAIAVVCFVGAWQAFTGIGN